MEDSASTRQLIVFLQHNGLWLSHVKRRQKLAYTEKNTLPTVKHGGGSVMLGAGAVSHLQVQGISTVCKVP